MHEEALLRDLLRKTCEVAATNGATQVRSLTVWVGALSHLSDPQFRARFALAAEGTVAERAQLRIERSDDVSDPRAQGIVLVSVELAPGREASSSAAPPAL